MKILRIIARLNVGGPARHVVWLTGALNDDEFESELIAGSVPAGEEDMAYFAAENGVEPIFIAEMSRELSLKDAVSLYKIYREIKRFRPDIIHTHTAKAGTIGRIAAFIYRWITPKTLIGRPRRARVVHTFHGHVFHSYYGKLKTAVFVAIERILARLATDRIIVITPQQFDEIHNRFNVGRAKQFTVVPLGIDLAPFGESDEKRQEFRREIGAEDDEILVGFIGRLTEIKNIPMLLKVAELLGRQESGVVPAMRFLIVGDGHLRKSLETEAEACGVSKSVLFMGNRTDADIVYAGLDIVALTSLNEGTPLSLIEGMAASRPVISTTVGGVNDLLGNIVESRNGFDIRERGLSADSNDAEGFCNGLLYLAKNERLRERLGKGGRAFVETKYSKQRLIDDMRILYRSFTA